MSTERDDAAVVYRHLRDVGPADAVTLAGSCFPLGPDVRSAPPSTVAALSKRSLERVFDAVLWLRAHGVTVYLSRHGSTFEIVSSSP